MAGLIDPNVSGDMADLNLPIMMTVTLRKTIGDVVWDGTYAINRNTKIADVSGRSKKITKFSFLFHCGDSIKVFLMFVKG